MNYFEGSSMVKQFIDEEIEVVFGKEFILMKKPPCPQAIIWRGKKIFVKELISSWEDFSRKGDMARNMHKEHLLRARRKGSWGVGRFYFKYKDEIGRTVTIYYDRSPKSASDRKGKWVLFSIEEAN
jgi:hypothetical protein